jgi:hypothetical protein
VSGTDSTIVRRLVNLEQVGCGVTAPWSVVGYQAVIPVYGVFGLMARHVHSGPWHMCSEIRCASGWNADNCRVRGLAAERLSSSEQSRVAAAAV